MAAGEKTASTRLNLVVVRWAWCNQVCACLGATAEHDLATPAKQTLNPWRINGLRPRTHDNNGYTGS